MIKQIKIKSLNKKRKSKVLPLKNCSLWIHHFWEFAISTNWARWPARKTRPWGSEKCRGNLTPRDVTLVIRLWLSTQTRQATRWLRQFSFKRESISPGLSLSLHKSLCQEKHSVTSFTTTQIYSSPLTTPPKSQPKCQWWYKECSAPAPLGKLLDFFHYQWPSLHVSGDITLHQSNSQSHEIDHTRYFNQEWIHLLSLTYQKHIGNEPCYSLGMGRLTRDPLRSGTGADSDAWQKPSCQE